MPTSPASSGLRRGRGRLQAASLGVGVVTVVGGAALPALASTAPSLSCTSNARTADACHDVSTFASAHDGGVTQVLKVEADTEAHGGTVPHHVYDIRHQACNGTIHVAHVFASDTNEAANGTAESRPVWWQSTAETQSTGNAGNSGSGSTSGSSPDHGSGNSASADTAASHAAMSYVKTHWPSAAVTGVKKEHKNVNGQKDYYQVKLQLRHGTTNVWVDGSNSSHVVTAVQGHGLSYRDPNVITPSQAEAAAVTKMGGTAYKASEHGSKWRWYWVFVRDGSSKHKVGVDAVTGVVTQVKGS